MLQIRPAIADDLPLLLRLQEQQGAAREDQYFERSLEQRDIFIATWAGEPAGYVMFSPHPRYSLYKKLGIPEIQDLNVLSSFRRRGIGEAMVKHCEDLARKRGADMTGISVGLHAGFGAAQRLYVRLGYIPDGHGVTYDRDPVKPGERCAVDDNLALMMVKVLR